MNPKPQIVVPEGFIVVVSTRLRAVKWTEKVPATLTEKAKGDLEVVFPNGGHYSYGAVPQPVFQAILNATSKGQAFGELILKAQPPYVYQRLGTLAAAPAPAASPTTPE